MKRMILLYFLYLVIIGCERNGKNPDKSETIKFNFSENSSSYEDVFKESTVIPLETNGNCLVSQISQLDVVDDKIFILDHKLNSLLVFSKEGKFLNRIGGIGRGPGEYIRPRYFFIGSEEKLVKVFDAPTNRLISYDYNGRYINEIRFGIYLRGIGETKSGYWGFCANIANADINGEQKKYIKFILFDHDGKVDKYVSGEKTIDDANLTSAYILNEADGSVSFVEPYFANIYSLIDDGVSVKFRIDFSGHFPPDYILKEVENFKKPYTPRKMEFLNSLTNKYASFFTHFYENENRLLLYTPFQYRTLIYNKNSNNSFEYSGDIYSNNPSQVNFVPRYLSDSAVYFETNYLNIKSTLEAENEIPAARKEILKKLLKETKMDDNPVIIKCVFNE